MLAAVSVTAQKKKANSFNDCYLSSAVSTFNLSEESKAKLSDALTEKLDENRNIVQQVKSKEISKEDAKTQSRANNQKYFTALASITGKSKKEVMDFEKSTKEKCVKKLI